MSITIFKSKNTDYLAEVCGRKLGKRAVELRHDTDMAVTRSSSPCVSCQKDTQEMNCLTTPVEFCTILSTASSTTTDEKAGDFDAGFKD